MATGKHWQQVATFPATQRKGLRASRSFGGSHTFRHTYSSLLKANGADTKVMQELLRHASSRVTLDTYTRRSFVRSAKPKTKSFGSCTRDTSSSGLRSCAFLCLDQIRQFWLSH